MRPQTAKDTPLVVPKKLCPGCDVVDGEYERTTPGNERWGLPDKTDRIQPNLYRAHREMKFSMYSGPGIFDNYKERKRQEDRGWQRLPWDDGSPTSSELPTIHNGEFECFDCGGELNFLNSEEKFCSNCGLVVSLIPRCSACGGELRSIDGEEYCLECGLIIERDPLARTTIGTHIQITNDGNFVFTDNSEDTPTRGKNEDQRPYEKVPRNRYSLAPESGEPIKCSIADCQRGYIKEHGDLPDELSWPEACSSTFCLLPSIDNPPALELIPRNGAVTIYEEYTDGELADLFETFKWTPKDRKTIKKVRSQPDRPKLKHKNFIPPYAYQKFEGTQIGDLLKASEKAGRAALHGLLLYDVMLAFYDKPIVTLVSKEISLIPTRENIIKFFQKIHVAGVDPVGKRSAEDYFDKLVEFGIIKVLSERGLCYVVARTAHRENQILWEIPCLPLGSHECYLGANK